MSRLSRALEKARREGTLETITDRDRLQSDRDDQDGSPRGVLSRAASLSNGRIGERGPLSVQVGDFGDPDEHLVSLIDPESPPSEHFRVLRFSIERIRNEFGASVIGVTSPTPGDGKTFTTLNLAGSLSQDESVRVLVVDADLRIASVGVWLGLRSSGLGLSGALVRSNCSIMEVAFAHSGYNLTVLPAGTPTSAPYELFNSPRLEAVLQETRSLFDYVLIDTPALMLPECRLLERHVDGFIVVVAAHRTQRVHLKEGMEKLDPSKVIGLVFNEDTHRYSHIPRYG